MPVRTEPRSMRLLVLIASSRLADKALDLYQDERLPVIFRAHAYGTARSDVEDILGFGNIEKRMLVTAVPRWRAKSLLRALRRKLHLGDPNTGVAFTMRISGMSNVWINMLAYEAPETEEEEAAEMKETQQSMVIAVVRDGYSEEVMNAARRAGAGGGTVLHTRKIGNEQIMSLLGLNVQDKTEVVFILTPEKKRAELMDSISRSCGINTDAAGLVLSMPVGDVTGIDLD